MKRYIYTSQMLAVSVLSVACRTVAWHWLELATCIKQDLEGALYFL